MRALAVCLLVAWAACYVRALNCTYETPLGTLEFPAYPCPGNASCVVAAAQGQSSVQQMFIPIGCCPENLPVPCVTNLTSYYKLQGCCPEDHVCCVSTGMPAKTFMTGCALKASQCCVNTICPPNYRCCRQGSSSACCPEGTLCRADDFFVATTGDGFNSTRLRVSSFFPDITDDQLCIPLHVTQNLSLTFIDGFPTFYPLQMTEYLWDVPSGGTLQYVSGVNRTPDVSPCGRGFCHDTDECVSRYRNMSKPRIYRSPGLACSTAKMMDPVAWTGGCFHMGYEVEEASYEAGCCPPDTTACGGHVHTFTPYAINSHASPMLYYQVFGCAAENETCCYPFMCPVGAQCCTARRQVNGVDIDLETLTALFGEGLLATVNEGFNYCCPEDAYCCEYIPPSASNLQYASRRAKAVPFCGMDDTCTRDYYSGNRRLLPEEFTRVAIPFNGTHFSDSLYRREQLGIVGNVEYYTNTSTELQDTCYYQVDVNASDTNDVRYFDIECQILNGGNVTSTSGVEQVKFRGNFAPFDQLAIEGNISGPIVCPPTKPAPWCIMP